MNRSQRHRSRYRHRRSSSSIRTIIQLNSQQESIKSNNIVIDPKILWTKKKCHKYAMFKVGQKLKVVRNLISVLTDITSFSYQISKDEAYLQYGVVCFQINYRLLFRFLGRILHCACCWDHFNWILFYQQVMMSRCPCMGREASTDHGE